MKAFLMDAGRDFDIGADLPVNAPDLTVDLGLDILLDAMAAGDTFLRKAAEHGLHSGLASPAAIVYRQHVLAANIRFAAAGAGSVGGCARSRPDCG